MGKLILIGRKLEPVEAVSQEPDWRQANRGWIEGALRSALDLPSGGWVAVADSRQLGSEPLPVRVAGREWVVWRGSSGVRAGLDECPHMGAALSSGHCDAGEIVCPWHGLRLGGSAHGPWKPVTAHDDGVLIWLCLPEMLAPRESMSTTPYLPPRPARSLGAVMAQEARCDPADILANRLDPWHGAHYHPHSFGRLKVIEQSPHDITVRVAYRIAARLAVEVDARFHCPDPRSIVMTIVAGEGQGSVVETHATPLDPGRCLVLEATLATSDRPQFWGVVRLLGRWLRPMVRKAAHRLWVEDAAYAERRYELRTRRQADPARRVARS